MDKDTKKGSPETVQPLELIDPTWVWATHEEYYWDYQARIDAPGSPNHNLEALPPAMRAGGRIRRTTPLAVGHDGNPSKDKPVVYKVFASLDGSPESFIAFANKYGDLGVYKPLSIETALRPFEHGESHAFWLCEQWLLWAADMLWDWIQQGDLEKLSAVVKCTDSWQGTWEYVVGEIGNVELFRSASMKFDEELRYEVVNGHSRIWLTETPTGIKPFVLRGRITKWDIGGFLQETQIKEAASLVLACIVNDQLKNYRTGPIAKYILEKDRIEERLFPTSLLAGIWLQFFRVITGKLIVKNCPVCQQWSDVTNLKYSWAKHHDCANWDRVTKSRKLPAIKKMISQGILIEDIAQRVNVEKRHISRWLTNKE